MKRTVAKVWINYTVMPMNVNPEKYPVVPSLSGKTQVITFWGLLRMARNWPVGRHRSWMQFASAIGLLLAIVIGCHPATTS